MKIAHICLACFYIEGWGYQENILPKYHVKMGNEVLLLTSDYMFNRQGKSETKQERDYINPHGVHIKVLGKVSRFGKYAGILRELTAFQPDIIFVHGGQFVSLKDVVAYCRKNREVKLFIDQHADFYNTPVNTLKQKIAAKWIYGRHIRKSVRYASCFWGVTPWRCEYLHKVYGVPEEKIKLLVMGGDDEEIPTGRSGEIRAAIREDLQIPDGAFVVVTGGKIDPAKNIHLLAQAVAAMNRENVHLIIFGQPNAQMEKPMQKFAQLPNCHFVGWIDSGKVYDYFLASDLAVFPGTHSVLWEQVCASGIPALFKNWEGMHHVSVNGSSEFLYRDSPEEIRKKLLEIIDDTQKYAAMKQAAEACKQDFWYSNIAKRAIADVNEDV